MLKIIKESDELSNEEYAEIYLIYNRNNGEYSFTVPVNDEILKLAESYGIDCYIYSDPESGPEFDDIETYKISSKDRDFIVEFHKLLDEKDLIPDPYADYDY